jgi:hypothetical protein
MRGRLARLGSFVLLLSTLGCAKKALQTLDGRGSGTIGPNADGGAAHDGTAGADAGAADGPWDAPFAGRRSFVVTSRVSTDGRPPFAHKFTIVVDLDSQLATIGRADTGALIAVLEPTGTSALRIIDVSFYLPVPPPCSARLAYDDLTFTIDASGRLSGSGRGLLWISTPDGVTTPVATMVLTGAPDTEPPTFDLWASGDPADPWTQLLVLASEPLPVEQVRPLLRSAGGDAIALDATTSTADMYVATFSNPRRLLRFAEPYRITFEGLTDFAGNPATSNGDITFTTRAAPPLVAADGFESVSTDTLGGAQVLSGANTPTLSGARSLYVPPAASLGSSGQVTQFAVRLPIPAGSTTLRFDYRLVNPNGTFLDSYFIIASVGGEIGTAVLESNDHDSTTAATIGQTQVSLGPRRTVTSVLPTDVHDEVVIARIATPSALCSRDTPRAVPGLIIDDLRAE